MNLEIKIKSISGCLLKVTRNSRTTPTPQSLAREGLWGKNHREK